MFNPATHPLRGLTPDRSTIDRMMVTLTTVQSVTERIDLREASKPTPVERKAA